MDKLEFKPNSARGICFTDYNGHKVTVTARIENLNDYLELCFTGSCNGGSGQIVDRILPSNQSQLKVVELWKEWHMNGSNSGTKNQQKCLAEMPDDFEPEMEDFDRNCAWLKKQGKYKVTYKGKPYKYGHAWIRKTLTENIIKKVNWIFMLVEKHEWENVRDYTPPPDPPEKSVRHYPKTDRFRVINTIGIPHAYCITTRHVSHAADNWHGMLSAEAIRDAEKHGAGCGICRKLWDEYRREPLKYDEHKKGLVVEVRNPKDKDEELRQYLLNIKELAEKEGYEGFAFVKAER